MCTIEPGTSFRYAGRRIAHKFKVVYGYNYQFYQIIIILLVYQSAKIRDLNYTSNTDAYRSRVWKFQIIIYIMKEPQKNQNSEQNVSYERLAIKGFQWLQENVNKNIVNALGSTGFKSFKIQDEKKKWKKKKCKCFQGLGEKIDLIIRSNCKMRQANTAEIKEKLFEKTLERIELKNSYEKICQNRKVSQIYQKEKNYRAAAINDYFDQQIQWIDAKIKML